jgi:hypothetical protein
MDDNRVAKGVVDLIIRWRKELQDKSPFKEIDKASIATGRNAMPPDANPDAMIPPELDMLSRCARDLQDVLMAAIGNPLVAIGENPLEAIRDLLGTRTDNEFMYGYDSLGRHE